MPARKIGLLILLLVVGLGIEGAWQARRAGFGPGAWRLFGFGHRFAGPQFTYESSGERVAGPQLEKVLLANVFGDVEVRSGETDEVRVALRKVVYAPDEELARSVADEIELTWDVGPTTLRVGTNRSEVEERRRDEDVAFETHLALEMPARLALRVENDHGKVIASTVAAAEITNANGMVEIADVAGAVDVKNRHGDLTVRRVGGALVADVAHAVLTIAEVAGETTVSLKNGEAQLEGVGKLGADLSNGRLEAHDVRGDVRIQARHAPIVLAGVQGAIEAESSYGDITCERVQGSAKLRTSHAPIVAREIAGPVEARTSYADVRLAEVDGRVAAEVRHGSVEAEDLRGGASIKTNGGRVDVQGFRGEVLAEAERGSVRLVADGPIEAPITASAKHGGVRLIIPDGGHLDLEATASRGRVEVDVPGLDLRESSGERVLGRLDGGGVSVRLNAQSGDVDVGTSE